MSMQLNFLLFRLVFSENWSSNPIGVFSQCKVKHSNNLSGGVISPAWSPLLAAHNRFLSCTCWSCINTRFGSKFLEEVLFTYFFTFWFLLLLTTMPLNIQFHRERNSVKLLTLILFQILLFIKHVQYIISENTQSRKCVCGCVCDLVHVEESWERVCLFCEVSSAGLPPYSPYRKLPLHRTWSPGLSHNGYNVMQFVFFWILSHVIVGSWVLVEESKDQI